MAILPQASHNSLQEFWAIPHDRTSATGSGDTFSVLPLNFLIEIRVCDGHSKCSTLTLLSLSHFVTNLDVFCPFGSQQLYSFSGCVYICIYNNVTHTEVFAHCTVASLVNINDNFVQ